MKKLEDLTLEEFELLKQSGMLWEFFPEAPLFFDEINDELDDYFPPSKDDDYEIKRLKTQISK
jgi:hypothetical protein